MAAAAELVNLCELLVVLVASNAAARERTLAAAELRSLLVLCCGMAGVGPA